MSRKDYYTCNTYIYVAYDDYVLRPCRAERAGRQADTLFVPASRALQAVLSRFAADQPPSLLQHFSTGAATSTFVTTVY